MKDENAILKDLEGGCIMMNTSRWVFYEAQVHLLLDAFYAMQPFISIKRPNNKLSRLAFSVECSSTQKQKKVSDESV